MLRTRLWMGAVLIVLIIGMLWLDQKLAPFYPFLLVVVSLLSLTACFELLQLLPANQRPVAWVCYAGVLGLILVNWIPPLLTRTDPWPWISGTFAAFVILAFLVEMTQFQQPGGSVVRIATTVWIGAYLGLLSCFLVQLRGLGERATVGLALCIFVPKFCDIGAYFTGRLLGRHPMSPVLSPKKTWEGAIGGLGLAALAAIVLESLQPVVPGGWLGAAVFGVTLGIVGILGDLAESLIKRDCQQKDASHVVPGFGGVLDVVDSILFCAPVAYVWLTW